MLYGLNSWILDILRESSYYVFLIDLKNKDEIVAQFELDYANFADRKRLGRITFWAVMNGHSVETMYKNDAEGVEQ